jgi:hypothetical protein
MTRAVAIAGLALAVAGCSQVEQAVGDAVSGAVITPVVTAVFDHVGVTLKGEPSCKTTTKTSDPTAAPAASVTCTATTTKGQSGTLVATGRLDDADETKIVVTVAGKVLWRGTLAQAREFAANLPTG